MAASTVDEIVARVKQNLVDLKSKLVDFSTSSNLYLLTRAFAAVLVEKEQDLNSAVADVNITTASKLALDLLAADFNIYRKEGTYAEGFVLLTSNSPQVTFVPAQTMLTAAGNLQYLTQEKSVISNTISSPVAVKAVQKGAAYNLKAGTSLSVKGKTGLAAQVGYAKNPITKEITGGLVRGSEVEKDPEFRTRIKSRISSAGRSSLESVRQAALSVEGIENVLIKEQTPHSGYYTIYIDVSGTAEAPLSVLKEIDQAIAAYRPVGVGYFVKPLLKNPIDLNIFISIPNSLDKNKIYNDVELFVNNYLDLISVGETLNLKKLEGALYRFDITQATVTSPSAITKENTKIKLNKLTLTIEIDG